MFLFSLAKCEHHQWHKLVDSLWTHFCHDNHTQPLRIKQVNQHSRPQGAKIPPTENEMVGLHRSFLLTFSFVLTNNFGHESIKCVLCNLEPGSAENALIKFVGMCRRAVFVGMSILWQDRSAFDTERVTPSLLAFPRSAACMAALSARGQLCCN